MSDLRRWPEEGATADEISLLAASRRERAPSLARSQTLRALGLAGALTTAATSITAAATTGTVTNSALSLVIKLLAISLFGGAAARVVVGSVWHPAVVTSIRTAVTSSPTAPTVVEPPNATLSPPAPVVESSSAVLTPRTVASSAIDPAVVAAVPARVRPTSSPYGSLSMEVSAIESAHRALSDHEPESALRLLDRYRARFPAGALAPEETAMRAQALLAAGRRARAQALADSYLPTHPDSPYGQWLMELVRSK